jgi:ATP-binding cassette subfamily B protein
MDKSKKKKKPFDALISIYGCMKLIHSLDKYVIPLSLTRMLCNATYELTATLLSASVIDGLVKGMEFKELILIVATGVGLIFILNSATTVAGKFLEVHKERCRNLYPSKVGEKTLEMDYAQLESPVSTDIRRRMEEDNNYGHGLNEAMEQIYYLTRVIANFVTAVIFLWPLFTETTIYLQPDFYLFIIIISAVNIFISIYPVNKLNKKSSELMEKKSVEKKTYMYHVFETGQTEYKKGKDIRIYDAGKLFINAIMPGVRLFNSTCNKLNHWRALRNVCGEFSYVFITGVSFIYAAIKASSGMFGAGGVIRYAAGFNMLMFAICYIFFQVTRFDLTAKRQLSTVEFLNIKKEMPEGTAAVDIANADKIILEFKNVSFRYPGSNKDALHDFSIKLETGRKMAVVGMNGSGKTTFIKLLCRLYDPTSGEILLNGVNIKEYDYKEYLSVFSVVFQDFSLFSFSLGQNVAASMEYDRMRVEECLRKSGFTNRLASMKNGTETYLYKNFDDEGVEISGGEAQKIALARALYKNAPFIILDEPTAALDPIAEFEIYNKFNEIIGGKTAIFISHRLSSCRFCDDIAVFHEGALIQRGSHETLVADTEGKYYELWHAQAQYYA